jgi:hypothetical protein
MTKTPTKTAQAAPKARATRDWEAVERDYRTGKFTFRELETKHGIPYGTISARATRENWSRDLRSVIRQRASAALVEELAAQGTAQVAQSAAQTVQLAAEQAKAVMLSHRTRAQALAATALELLGELSRAALLAQEQELLAQILAGSGAEPKDEAEARRVVQKALSLGGRASTVKLLTDSLARVQDMERQAWDLEEGPPPPEKPPLDLDSMTTDQQVAALQELLSGAR